jgi:hypothetical protein
MPFTGRGCFMVYVGLGCFYGNFGFIELVGIVTIALGLGFIIVGCTGKVKDPHAEAVAAPAANAANRV